MEAARLGNSCICCKYLYLFVYLYFSRLGSWGSWEGGEGDEKYRIMKFTGGQVGASVTAAAPTSPAPAPRPVSDPTIVL